MGFFLAPLGILVAGLTLSLVKPQGPTTWEWPSLQVPTMPRSFVPNLCLVRECCHANDGTGYLFYQDGAENLLKSLRTEVHGQPLILKPIYASIKAHLANDKPQRPLVMYFSGWTGTGKTHVARIIAKSLYKEGMKSRFVRYISSSYHFPPKIETESDILKHRHRLREMIRETVVQCERSLIILDELDKLPPGVVDSLQPLLDYLEDVDGVSYTKSIFIFLSNTGAEKLNALSYKMFTEGKEREDLSSKDIEEILIMESFNEQGGLRGSSLLRRHSIGVFVPFLPLERKHVKMCVRDELVKQQNVIEKKDAVDRKELAEKGAATENLINDTLVEEIAGEIIYFPEDTRLYSKSGCKGVHDKVINFVSPL